MDDEKFTKLIILAQNIDYGQRRIGSYDLCKECNDSFSKWLSEPSVVNGNRSCFGEYDDCFGEYDDEEYGCVSCSTEQECKAVSKKKDAPKCFGKFDGNDHDCILCGLANDCEGKANE